MPKTIFSILFISCFWNSVYSQDSLKIDKTGIYLGLNIGTWFPDNKNRVLGNPSILGIAIDFKGQKNSLGFSFDMIGVPFNTTKAPILIKHDDSLIVRNEYSGVHFTLDYCRQFYETKRVAFEGICSAGFGQLSYYNPNPKTNVDKNSFVFSPGISVRFAITPKVVIQLKTQYCIANYRLNDNLSTDFRGNYLITKINISTLTN